MQIQFEKVSPTLAQQYLLKNVDNNRPINNKRVDFYASQMSKGQWRMSPQGIIFDRAGKLIDGQHRLHAIVRSNKTVDICVLYGAEPETFDVLDSGQGRTLSFRAGLGNQQSSLAAALWKLFTGTSDAISVDDLNKTYDVFKEAIDRLGGDTKRARISVAPVMAAVALHMREGNLNAYDQYKAMVLIDTEKMTPATAGLFKRLYDRPSINGAQSERNEVFVRTYKALSKKSQEKNTSGKMLITDMPAELAVLRMKLSDLLK